MIQNSQKFMEWMTQKGKRTKLAFTWDIFKARVWMLGLKYNLLLVVPERKRWTITNRLFIRNLEPMLAFFKEQNNYWDRQEVQKIEECLDLAKLISAAKESPAYLTVDDKDREQLDYKQASAIRTASVAISELMSKGT